jgi:hypothetical protein
VFPAAILQPPFFDPEADDAVNFGDRRSHRPRDRARLRRPGQPLRRPGQPGRLVDRRRPGRVRRAGASAHRPVRRLRARGAGRPSRQRRAHRGREHRRPGRHHHRPQGLPAEPEGPRRPCSTGSPAASGCSSAGARCGGRWCATPSRSAGWPSTLTPARVPGQRGAQPRRVPRDV